MTIKEAIEITGGLSSPSKMPCYSYNLPAQNCNIGSKLRNVPNSVCNKCYALKGFYNYPNPRNAMQKRLQSLTHPMWVKAMTFLIGQLEYSGYMRFHDSGDIQNLIHFKNIIDIATNLPNINFWLPTREYGIIGEAIENEIKIPNNLIVRLSAYMIDGELPIKLAKRYNVAVSGVSSKNDHNCPASSQGNFCLTCRACWDTSKTVIYKKH
ncbi:MAG: GP88 family protein [Crocinitomicaceae bacterium]